MKALWLILLTAATTIPTMHAGVLQGLVLEQASGRPMARTQIRVVPVPEVAVPALRSGSMDRLRRLSYQRFLRPERSR